jgi:cation diffusion facilitator family transporter
MGEQQAASTTPGVMAAAADATTVGDRESQRRAMYRRATRAAALGGLINLALGVTKVLAGWWGNSLALLSDAVNSFGDVMVSLVVLVGLRVAQRPRSALHPYGYMRAEAIAASNVALIVIATAASIAWEAVRRWTEPQGVPSLGLLAIASANVVIKEALYQYKVRVGRKTGSTALLANAWDHRSDALCSVAVLMGLSVVRWGGQGWHWADEAAALLVAVAIAWTGISLFRVAARELLDAQAEEPLVDSIRRAASGVPGVHRIEKLWVRKAGLEYFVDIHIEVDPHTTVADGHRTAHRVKDQLLEAFPTIRDILVHLEPAGDPEPPSTPIT